MSSTILSSLGESILHSNSLATVTDNWIVVRPAQSCAQVVVSIESIATVKTFTTKQFHYLSCAFGSLIMAVATTCSKEADGATLPFALVGLILLTGAQVTRQAALALQVDDDTIHTAYGTLREAATLVAAIRCAQDARRRGDQATHDFLSWVRAYIALLV